MRCNWFPKARCILHPKKFSAAASSLRPSPPNSNLSLTPAQISRHVWRAVHVALHARDIQAAYIIAESARLSNNPLLHNIPSKAYLATGIHFHQPVSQRLTGHTLIHGLLRLGLPRKAHAVVKVMMDNGVPIRTRTFEAVLQDLVDLDSDRTHPPRSTNTVGLGTELYNHLKTLLPNRQTVLPLHPSVVHGKNTRAALDLFLCARNSKRQRRTERMYRTLIGSCLLHGELIAATLLITAILRDCAVRETLARQLEFTGGEQGEEAKIVEEYRKLKRLSPYPSFDILKEIIASISYVLSRSNRTELIGDDNDEHKISFRAALQALANLAYMLDIRQMPFAHLASLIRLLYTCPRNEEVVWVVDRKRGGREKPVQIGAYGYFHAVLERFLGRLPRFRSEPPTPLPSLSSSNQSLAVRWNSSMVNERPLDLPACNSLLYYALRHRLSTPMAQGVLMYIQDPFWVGDRDVKKRWKRPRVNEVTLNIVLSAARVMRDEGMAGEVLEVWRERGRGLEVVGREVEDEVLSQSLEANSISDSSVVSPYPSFSTSSSSASPSMLISTPATLPARRLRPDKYTIVSYISYLTSIGRPDVVPGILFRLLPELIIIDHPSSSPSSTSEPYSDSDSDSSSRNSNTTRNSKAIMAREECLKRVVSYGPHFFVAILNALVKLGKTGLAERVWLLAREAERASWIERFNPGSSSSPGADGRESLGSHLNGTGKVVQGWCLPIHAYTLMLVCYGNEARKSMYQSIRSSSRLRSRSWAVRARGGRRRGGGDVTPDEATWIPRSSASGNRYVAGWAYYILKRRQQLALQMGNGIQGGTVGRSEAGRAMGVELYRSMVRGAQGVYWALRAFERDAYPPQSPSPSPRSGPHLGLGPNHPYVPSWIQENEDGTGLPPLPSAWRDQVPKADARFFNAMLRIVTRHAYGQEDRYPPRRAHTSRAHWRQHVRFAEWMYRVHGVVPMNRSVGLGQAASSVGADVEVEMGVGGDGYGYGGTSGIGIGTRDELLMVAEDMVGAGYNVPHGVRYLLVGRDGESSAMRRWYRDESAGKTEGRSSVPWAYPVDGPDDSPFALGVVKQKGLSSGRVFRGRRRR
ncbi:hypothetical protein D9757_005244 [Collybiopsis confluens]|uniref:Pentatricopeptide repeat-containing protein n=1 Tax=Collybiopsis confluens TaxID=2823264 RepID=A0A8H5HW17_9AGAR|nr:hypothetical protein D9757_005244 [Collybiopsis confluens]